MSNLDVHLPVISQQSTPFRVVIMIKGIKCLFPYVAANAKCPINWQTISSSQAFNLESWHQMQRQVLRFKAGHWKKTVSHCSFTSVATCPLMISRQMTVPNSLTLTVYQVSWEAVHWYNCTWAYTHKTYTYDLRRTHHIRGTLTFRQPTQARITCSR